jgi:flagellar protein FlgJ
MLGPLLALSATAAIVGGSVTAAAAASVTTTVAGPLNIRADANTRSATVGRLGNGAKVALVCKVVGENIRGKLRTSNEWDRTTSGRYVSHAYVHGANSLPACPAPAPPVAATPVGLGMLTGGPNGSMTHAQFVAASVAPAQQGQREFRVPASVTIAQAILESGWGGSGLTTRDRNFFGIKCFNGVTGPIANGCHSYATSECVKNVCSPTTATFRTYASATDSFRDHGRFLVVNERYAPAFAYTGNADQFLFQIWKAGYATSPTYVQNVSGLMHQYNLYQYDLH